MSSWAGAQHLVVLLSRHSPGLQCPADDVTLDYCCRVAETTDPGDEDDVATLTDLLNDLLLQHTPPHTATTTSNSSSAGPSQHLAAAQVVTWLQQLHDPQTHPGPDDGSASTAQPAQQTTPGPSPPPATAPQAAALGQDTQQPDKAAGTPAASLHSSASGSHTDAAMPAAAAAAAVHHRWNLSAVEFVPGGPPAAAAASSAPAAVSGNDSTSNPEAAAAVAASYHAAPTPPDSWDPSGAHEEDDAWYQAEPGEYGDRWGDGCGWGWCEGGEAWPDEAAGNACADGDVCPVGDMDPEGLLIGMFPAYDRTLLRRLLDMHGTNLNAAVDELLMLEGGHVAPAGAGASRTPQAAQEQQEQPVASVPSSAAVARSLALGDQEAFPTLGTAAANAASSPSGPGVQPQPSTWAHVIGSKPAAQPVERSPARSVPSNSTSASGGGGGSHQRLGRQGGAGWVGPAHGVPQVATGAVLAAQYQEARQEARDWARARNMCFQQATQAYLSGNKALAKELSARGKHYAERMWAAHGEAVQELMATRGAVRSSNVPGGPVLLDLHGLHIREALAVLREHLQQGAAAPAPGIRHTPSGQVLHVLVGVGKHSKTAASAPARLLTAVQLELEAMGVRYQQLQPGLLAVPLDRR